MDTTLRVLREEDGWYTIRECIEDEEDGTLVSMNPLMPLGETYDGLKGELLDFLEAFDLPVLHEKDVGFFSIEVKEYASH
jgi:hypothetical protein